MLLMVVLMQGRKAKLEEVLLLVLLQASVWEGAWLQVQERLRETRVLEAVLQQVQVQVQVQMKQVQRM